MARPTDPVHRRGRVVELEPGLHVRRQLLRRFLEADGGSTGYKSSHGPLSASPFRRRLLTLPDVLQGCCRFAARTWSRLLPPCFFRFFVREHDWEVAVASGERDGRVSSCEPHGSGDGDLRLRFLKRSLLAWDSTARGEGRIVVRVAVLVSIGVFRVETPLCRTVR